MAHEEVVTRYAALTRRQALAVVAAALALMAWLIAGATFAASPSTPSAGRPSLEHSDVALYKAIVARVRAGEGYYDAAAVELRAGRYPMSSPFNWRLPTSAWLLARFPSPLFASALLVMLGGAVVSLLRRWLNASEWRRHVPAATAIAIVTLASAFVGDFVYLQESWAGFLIALSVCLFACDRRSWGVAAVLAALAFRELALLPCAVGLALALRERRGREVAAWLAGLAAYGAVMLWHCDEVARRVRPDDLARGWFAHRGATFILETCTWNSFFVALPSWAIAVLLPFVLLGLAGWRAAAVTRATLIVVGYLLAFTAIGHAFNDYWGAIYTPLLIFGFIAAPASVRDLARALRGGAARG